MIVSNHSYNYNPSDNRSWRHEKWLTELLCLSCTVVSAAALPTAKKTPFRTQEGLCTTGQEELCAGNGASDDVFTFEGVSSSPGLGRTICTVLNL